MYLAIVVNSYKRNSMIKAKSAYIRLFDKNREIGKFVLKKTKDCIGLLFGLFSRRPGTAEWYFRVMVDPLSGNIISNSIEDLKQLLTGYSFNNNSNNNSYNSNSVKINHPLPGEQMLIKGSWFPVETAFTNIGLGWDFQVGQISDLDTGAIIFDQIGNVLDIIFHKNLQSKDSAIKHCGDNKSGLGEGDDEIISINFPALHPSITVIAIVVNSFKGNSLLGVKNGFIRVFDMRGPIGCHLIGQFLDCVGLLLGLFRKSSEGRWFFQVMIDPIRGVQATESVNDVRFLMANYPLILPPPQTNKDESNNNNNVTSISGSGGIYSNNNMITINMNK